MTWFTVKKTLFDGWDSFMGLVLLNAGFVAVAAAALGAAALLGPGLAGSLVLGAGFLAFEVARVAAAIALLPVATGANASFREWLAAWGKAWKPGLAIGAIELALLLAVRAAVPFYLGMDSLLGPVALGVVLWTAAFGLLGMQWIPAARALMPDKRLGGLFRVSFAFLFDNLGFSLFVAAWNAVGLAISFFLAFLAPGFAGATLARVEAFRLRLYRYDWQKANPDADRKKTPWKELLAEDADRLGPRTLRNLIFPWKD